MNPISKGNYSDFYYYVMEEVQMLWTDEEVTNSGRGSETDAHLQQVSQSVVCKENTNNFAEICSDREPSEKFVMEQPNLPVGRWQLCENATPHLSLFQPD